MEKLVRKQVYLTRSQAARAGRRARAEGVAEAEIIRRALDAGLDRMEEPEAARRDQALLRVLALASAVASRGSVPGGRRWTRDELYDRGSR